MSIASEDWRPLGEPSAADSGISKGNELVDGKREAFAAQAKQLVVWKCIAALAFSASIFLLALLAVPQLAPNACQTSAAASNEKMAAEEAMANLTDRLAKLKAEIEIAHQQKLATNGMDVGNETGVANLARGAGPAASQRFPAECIGWQIVDATINPFIIYIAEFNEPMPMMENESERRTIVRFWKLDINTTKREYLISQISTEFPIPTAPMPDYITGFAFIIIHILDDDVLEFIRLIGPKLKNIQLKVRSTAFWQFNDKWMKAFRSFFNILDNKISTFSFDFGGLINLNKFNQMMPGYIDQMDSLSISRHIQPTHSVDYLIKWLTIEGKKQQILNFDLNGAKDILSGPIIEEFTNATSAHNFIVYFPFISDHPNNFTLENPNTGEVLISYRNLEFNDNKFGRFLLRCPKGEEDQWKKEGEEKMTPLQYEIGSPDNPFILFEGILRVGRLEKFA